MAKARILIVEDEAIVAEDLSQKLKRLGYEPVGITAKGEESVASARNRHPDLVLMDIRLQGPMDGVEAAQTLRRECGLPVVYLTAHSDVKTLERAKVTEPFGYLLKPFETAQLETQIEMALYKHRAEREAERHREWLKVTLRSIGDAVITTDAEGRVTSLNPAAEELTGWKMAEGLNRPLAEIFQIINEDTREPVANPVSRVLKEGQVVGQANHTTLISRTGRETAIEDRAAPIKDALGRILGVVMVFHDVTEKRRAETVLRDSQHRLNLALHSTQMGVWDWHLPSNRRTWDERMFQLYGLAAKPGASADQLWEQGLHPEDKDRALAARDAALRGESGYDIEFRVRHPDGNIRHIKANGLVVRDEQQKPVRMLGVNYDVTERKQLQEQLLQSQKMEAVGQLAGGVAHDFNNILGATMLHLGLLEQKTNLDEETREALQEIQRDTQRAADLTRQLLLFSRRSMPEMKPVDLHEAVTHLLKLLKRLIGERIAFKVDYRVNLPAVIADPGMVEQMLMNLCVNARDAMPQGGEIEIGFSLLEAGPERIAGRPDARPGWYVCLSVADTGCGMDEATRRHIFEPFFTTKEQGKGTGLGLATVHGIVGLHKGWVEVESELGKGSVFRVFLPASEVQAREAGPKEKPKLLTGSETILLVEDEAGLRLVTSRSLRRLGYKVLDAADGQDALKIWREQRQNIDLLLSDMIMPGSLTGLELAERLREEKPALKVIISSGYSAETLPPEVAAEKRIVRMQKPYAVDILSETLRRCLDEK